MLADAVDVADDIIVPEAQDGVATALEMGRPPFIISHLFWRSMMTSIDFNDQMVCWANKVGNWRCTLMKA
ncbi:hypothetical protein ATN84_24190 [Paramesorhizobium deserti]|uniref:Uncharacterized protein n=1 Tax=Paramesorhizobium deserti TaxID=1494590 RepID=A0A135HY21_9HYPH|nr:hypothetical protein ATN84_24190 [Paramesorhizobium deserti]